MSPTAWLFFAGLCLFELAADVLAKEHTRHSGAWLLATLAVICYVTGNVSWIFALRFGAKLSIGAILFGVISGVIAVLVGWLWYKESISPVQWVGIAAGFVSIGLLSWEK